MKAAGQNGCTLQMIGWGYESHDIKEMHRRWHAELVVLLVLFGNSSSFIQHAVTMQLPRALMFRVSLSGYAMGLLGEEGQLLGRSDMVR